MQNKLLKIRVKYENWIFKLPFFSRYQGIVLYPWVLFKYGKKEVPDYLFRHELQHVYQVIQDGWFKFYIKYLYLTLKVGYSKNPYELDANAASSLPLTDKEKALREA